VPPASGEATLVPPCSDVFKINHLSKENGAFDTGVNFLLQ
jgi:hypothetical protein